MLFFFTSFCFLLLLLDIFIAVAKHGVSPEVPGRDSNLRPILQPIGALGMVRQCRLHFFSVRSEMRNAHVFPRLE
jgi:hypothetical protein